MTTEELLITLGREYPNGVSFDPMAVRLLRQKVAFADGQIDELKNEMFQLGKGLWFSKEMISEDEPRFSIMAQASKWLLEYGCFSVERLFESCRGVLRHIATPEYFAAYLRHLKFAVTAWGKGGFICFQPPAGLYAHLAATSQTIAERLEEVSGTLALEEIQEAMQHLTTEALDAIREKFLPEVHVAEVGGLPCWRSAEAIPLPEDFSGKLTTVVNTLVDLEERVNAANLTFALNVLYRFRFREEYALPDNDTFMRVCAKHYHGGHAVFSNTRKSRDPSSTGKRMRSPNTRFIYLGVPIGAELAFTKDSHITCAVLDDSNQVKYDGKAWAISALASHLLNVSGVNGFCHFSYEGETLWGRRLRLEREGRQDANQAEKMSPPDEVRAADNEIIGLEGHPLSPATWRAFRSAGTNPRVAEWARRIEKGESVEKLARESGYSTSTVKVQIGDRRRYFKVCEFNKIMPEGSVHV